MSTLNKSDLKFRSERKITFSIIIPTYCRPKQLSKCLESVSLLNFPRDDFEVLVVDDGSVMSPEGIVRGFGQRMNVTLLTLAHAGPAAARNTGASRSRGQFLAFTDDDCAPSPDWLRAFAKRLNESPDCMIGGHSVNTLVNNPYSEASQVLIDYLYTHLNADGRPGSFFASNNICMSSEHFRAVGGFDISFPRAAAEDREFCDRWMQRGYSLIYAPEAIIFHSHSLTLKTFWRQHYNYGRGASLFRRTRFHRNGEPIKVRRLKFYARLLGYAFSHGGIKSPAYVSILLGISQLATFAGFVLDSITTQFKAGRRAGS